MAARRRRSVLWAWGRLLVVLALPGLLLWVLTR